MSDTATQIQDKKPDYKRVMAEVDKVLTENAITSPPVLLSEIARNYGIALKAAKFTGEYKDVAGYIDFSDKVIYANADDPYTRQAFTIAHELGHYFLHRHLFEKHPEEYRVLMRRPIGAARDVVEIEANAFAANLLVPSKFLKKYADFASVKSLATLFIVSQDVIRIRLGKLFGY